MGALTAQWSRDLRPKRRSEVPIPSQVLQPFWTLCLLVYGYIMVVLKYKKIKNDMRNSWRVAGVKRPRSCCLAVISRGPCAQVLAHWWENLYDCSIIFSKVWCKNYTKSYELCAAIPTSVSRHFLTTEQRLSGHNDRSLHLIIIYVVFDIKLFIKYLGNP